MRLLVVEDEPDLARAVARSLTEAGFAVDVSADGEDALFRIREIDYDAVVLDVMLPRLDGWAVLEAARGAQIRTPILLLTARDEVTDRVRGLNLGADDYLVKPFAVAELIARVHAIIRRSYGSAAQRLEIGGLVIDMAARQVLRDGRPVELTAREFAILELLTRSRGAVVGRAAIYDHIYDDDTDVMSNAIDVHIAALRRKLGADLIRTRRGEGYVIDA
ncbi:MAG: response regulator transcription factor [Acidimicrobiia bacterium]|nr:response regulator transcription factor [Acidimicrobiia bacterium]